MKNYENYVNYCKDFIVDTLPEYTGAVQYLGDLCFTITEGINVNGTATFSTYEATQYIKEWFEDCGSYWEYEEREFGEHYHNPFDEPEAFMVCMIIGGVNNILSQCSIIKDNRDEEKTLDEKLINTILNQVQTITEIQF